MDNNALVSIIVPCYNIAEFLEEALDSVIAQSYVNLECIVIDDGSTDNTSKIVAEYIGQDNRFKYIKQSNAGPAAARNTGVRNSCGKYILPLDGDDFINSSYIEKSVKILEDSPNAKIVYCLAEHFGILSGIWLSNEYSYLKLLLDNMIFCTCLYRRVDYNAIDGYDESLLVKPLEDWDFLIRLLRNGGHVVKIPEVLFFYRIRYGSLMNSQDSERERQKAKKQIFKKNIDIYFEYFDDDPMLIYQQRHIILKSRRYKLGSIIVWPWYFFKRLLRI